jgi:hypothetical protein
VKRRDFLLSTAAAVVAPALPVPAAEAMPESPGAVSYCPYMHTRGWQIGGWQPGYRGGEWMASKTPLMPSHPIYVSPHPKEDTPCT